MSNYPILYSFRRCPWAMRGRIALHYAGVQCEIREVDLKNKPPALLEISSKATVPTMLLPDGTVIDESLDVIKYALSVNDPDDWFNADKAEVNRLLNIAEGSFAKAAHLYKYSDRFPEETLEDNRHKCEELLINEMEERLGKSKYLFGDKPSIADIGIVTLIRQFAAVDEEWWTKSEYSHTRNWLDNWLNSDRFSAIMKKYKPWQAGDDVVLFL